MQPIIRLIRRICLLHEQGAAAAAREFQSAELAAAVRGFRLQHGPDALPDNRLEEIFAAERNRAADAAVLAELLIPHLAGRSDTTARPAASTFTSPAPVRAAAEGPPGIPDLLDAMLAGERRAHQRRR